jgi:hypothetical protein
MVDGLAKLYEQLGETDAATSYRRLLSGSEKSSRE